MHLGVMRGFEAVWMDLSALRYDVGYCETIDNYSDISWSILEGLDVITGLCDAI